MGAHIPTCTKQDYLGVCPCDNCKSFLPMSKANKIIKSYLDLDKREENKGCAAMADLIDRDALEPFYEIGTDPNDTYADMTFIRAEHIENAPAVNRWIPVEDALPENSHPVLITWVNNSPVMSCYEKDKGKPFTGCAHYCNGKWYWYSQFSDDILSEYGEYQETVDVDVIAWMPMPDAYKPPEKECEENDKT